MNIVSTLKKMPLWSDVSVRQAIENKNLVSFGNISLVIYRIHSDAIRLHQLGFWALNHSDGSRFSIRASRESEDGLRELLRDSDFIMDFIVRETVHRPAHERFLAFDLTHRLCVLIRQPGECRNLRMGHSVGHQDLFALGVVRYRMGIADAQRRFVHRSAADCS